MNYKIGDIFTHELEQVTYQDLENTPKLHEYMPFYGGVVVLVIKREVIDIPSIDHYTIRLTLKVVGYQKINAQNSQNLTLKEKVFLVLGAIGVIIASPFAALFYVLRFIFRVLRYGNLHGK